MPQGSTLWSQAWCPLLQGMARLATDQRRNVRTGAITCLQRALLAHDLQTLSGCEWEGCFRQVLFPLLSNLLAEQVPVGDPSLMEESRMRTATIMSKVFLHHLTPLLSLSEFAHLWLEILEYLERFMRIGSDMLYEAMLEGLKNMLLVMHSVRVFHNADGVTHSQLWEITWEKIGQFLPNLKGDLFKVEEGRGKVQQLPGEHPQGQQQQQVVMPEVGFYPPAVEKGEAEEEIVPEILQSSVAVVEEVVHPQSVALVDQHPVQSGIEMPQEQNALYMNYQGELNHSPIAVYQSKSEEVVSPAPPPPSAPQQPHESMDVVMQQQQQQLMYQQQLLWQQQHQQQLLSTSPPPSAPAALNPSPTHQSNVPLPFSPATEQPPMSQVVTGNQYPTFTRMPPANIVQSFAPIYVQPTTVQSGGEIYSDYVRDPYNLTLPSQLASSAAETPAQPQPPPPVGPFAGNSNVFQSSNYFGSDTGVIPPGSEVLFGGTRP